MKMELIKEANHQYESELKRNPQVLRNWVNYINDSKACSHDVRVFSISNPFNFSSSEHGYAVVRLKFSQEVIKFGRFFSESKHPTFLYHFWTLQIRVSPLFANCLTNLCPI